VTLLVNRVAAVEIDSLRVEGLDIRFKVSVDDANTGQAEISIFNLNEGHRTHIEKSKDLETTLLVGYKETALSVLFNGVMRQGYSVREEQDWVTTLHTGDGDKASKARINRSYPPGASFDVMWKDCIDALSAQGIGVGNALSFFSQGQAANGVTQLLHGGAVQGQALKEIRRMAKSFGLDIMIQDQELVVTKIDTPVETSAVVLTPGTGLISSPQKGAKGLLKVRSLIIPGLRPKRVVRVRSALVDGDYVIKKAQYTGDLSANDWYADLECTEL